MILEKDMPVIEDLRRSIADFRGLSDVARVGSAGKVAADFVAKATILEAGLAAIEKALVAANTPPRQEAPKQEPKRYEQRR